MERWNVRFSGGVALCLALAACIGTSESQDPGCDVGTRGCACLEGDVPCSDPALACDARRLCVAVDIPASCKLGAKGCACTAAGSCEGDAACVDNLCTASPSAVCPPGTRGCACFVDGTCAAALGCVGGTCVATASEAISRPASLRCYTPCLSGIRTADGEVRTCSVDGLMEGCIDGQACIDGGCVRGGEDVRGCSGDADCPDHQNCFVLPGAMGRCLSSCTQDSQCPDALVCHKRACRFECQAQGQDCPKGHFCSTQDGQNGVCLPMVAASEVTSSPAIGRFSVDERTLQFSNIRTRAALTIVNESDQAREFTVRRKTQRETTLTGEVRFVDESPLVWVGIDRAGECAGNDLNEPYRVLVDANAEVEVEVCNTVNVELASWEGTLEISHPQLGKQEVDLAYAERPDGQWRGTFYSFANFETQGLDAWVAAGRPADLESYRVNNAFVRRWNDVKRGRLTYEEFRAVLSATETGSWAWPTVRERCPVEGGACYLYDNIDGYSVYTTSTQSIPVPSGRVAMPFAMNLRQRPGDPVAGDCAPVVYEGRIVTDEALQYPGNPKVQLTVGGDPAGCGATNFGVRILPVDDLRANAYVGARFAPTDGSCPGGGFVRNRTPWLLPGFLRGTVQDFDTGLLYRPECRDTSLPFDAGSGLSDLNPALAAANPIPDGKIRQRRLELVDGALIDQRSMVLLVREVFESFLPGTERFAAYGYITLEKAPTTLTADAFVGNDPNMTADAGDGVVLGVRCSPDLLNEIVGSTNPVLDGTSARKLVTSLLNGLPNDAPPVIDPAEERVHYLCVTPDDTSHFNNPPETADPRTCPSGSTVVYFTADLTLPQDQVLRESEVSKHACNRQGTCQSVLEKWVEAETLGLRVDPLWQCDDGTVACDNNRDDLREGKRFYQFVYAPKTIPLQSQVDNAFRYKTRFRNRVGMNAGFSPDICQQSASSIPYCYEPAGIEALEERLDCAFALLRDHHDLLDTGEQQRLVSSLQGALGVATAVDPRDGSVHKTEGFEYLQAELLIMLGDDAYTSAFASRFDLAGAAVYGFEGSLFEPEGIDLAAGAGFEMYRLYQAAQYYQKVLDRFFALSGQMNLDERRRLVTLNVVTSYFARLIRASTQKAKTWSEIASRYQNFNQPELAKFVIERAYSATYLESIVLGRFIRQAITTAAPQDRAQIERQLEASQDRYRSALLAMGETYENITADVNYFGYPPDYIPFPALGPQDSNAFEKLWTRGQDKIGSARVAESNALSMERSYETDRAMFQNELTKIDTTYENQLAEICGTFSSTDSRIYPAIPRYSHLHPVGLTGLDLCGFVGNGLLYEARLEVTLAQLDIDAVRQKFDNILGEIDLEVERVNQQCDLTLERRDFLIAQGGREITLQSRINAARNDIDLMRRLQNEAQQEAAVLSACSPSISASWPPSASMNPGACKAATDVRASVKTNGRKIEAKESNIRNQEVEFRKLEQATMRFEMAQQCEVAQVDSQARTASLTLSLAEIQIDALKVDYRIQLDKSKVQQLENKAERLLIEQQEAQQMAINLEASRNDPNVRIYKNDAILAADRTFNRALIEVYRLTKVYEYYTSQSYGRLGDLFLVRMVDSGEPSLSGYVEGLRDAFDAFQEQFGNPGIRVAVVSLRDDIMQVPRFGESGAVLSHGERVQAFRQQLQDVRLLDSRGYLRLPFSTRRSMVSPLTRNHKVHHIEAELEGARVGDEVGRVYLTQGGTSTVMGVDGGALFYAFPELTAVINTSFNGKKAFTPDVYQNFRLQDRPLLNTRWELYLNQRDEAVNQDIDLASLSDIRLVIYYTDFSAL